MSTILTIGHGAASLELFRGILENAGVTLVVDVRSQPYSRWNPQYSKPDLRHTLGLWSIQYEWRGQSLGGRGENIGFRDAVLEVAELARTRTVALLCSERSPAECHRRTMLAPAFQGEGLAVVHLLHDGTRETEPPATLPLF